MKLTALWTLRRMQHQVFRQIVEEWEDDFATELGLPLKDVSGCEKRANGRFGVLRRRFPAGVLPWDDGGRITSPRGRNCALAFLIWPPGHAASYWVQPDVVPIVIDCWRPHLAAAPEVFARSPFVFVTNREVERELAATTLGSRVRYLPLSVSARHLSGNIPPKTVDLIQVGRRNPLLHDWALEYVRRRPGTTYLFADTSGTWPRWLNAAGETIQVDATRASYWALLRSSRISLVSAPGIDGGEARTGGLNPVTPRFYESAAARCHLIGRFPADGADFETNRVGTVCPNVHTFDEFSAAADRARSYPVDTAALDRFLIGHTTAEVARRARDELAARWPIAA
jgi:hypothetical protein